MNNSLKLCILLFFIILFYKDGFNQNVSDTTCNFVYWDDFSGKEKLKFLKNNNIKNNNIKNTAIEYYTMEIKTLTADGPEMFELLDELTTTKNDTLLPFYFHVFNQICMDGNAVLGEAKGIYCIDFIINHPCYIFCYFSKQNKIRKNIYNCYISFIAFEFYMDPDIIDKTNYQYEKFRKMLLDVTENYCDSELIFPFLKEIKSKLDAGL